MDIRKLQRAIVDGLEDVKAQDIRVFNTEHLSPLFERVIVASGQSNRQTKALASSVRETVKKRGLAVLRTEGEDNGEWIIVDCGAAVAHIMQPSIRDYYRLEEIWGGKPVKIKLGATGGGLVKASEPMDEDDDEIAAAPARAGRPKARKAGATKPASGAEALKAESARTRKAAPKKPAAVQAPARGGSARSAALKSPAKKGAGGNKPAAGRSAAKPAAPSREKKIIVPAHSTRSAPAKPAAAGRKTAGARPAAAAKRAAPARKTPGRRG